jgi:DNA-directed RNA polymerase subunit RPC12/RpoP
MSQALRRWKCRDCSFTNETEIGLDGTAVCGHCSHRINVQPSRIKNGRILPAVYPTRLGTPRPALRIRSLGEL